MAVFGKTSDEHENTDHINVEFHAAIDKVHNAKLYSLISASKIDFFYDPYSRCGHVYINISGTTIIDFKFVHYECERSAGLCDASGIIRSKNSHFHDAITIICLVRDLGIVQDNFPFDRLLSFLDAGASDTEKLERDMINAVIDMDYSETYLEPLAGLEIKFQNTYRSNSLIVMRGSTIAFRCSIPKNWTPKCGVVPTFEINMNKAALLRFVSLIDMTAETYDFPIAAMSTYLKRHLNIA